MIVLDAGVLIALLDPNDPHHHDAHRLISDNIEDELTIGPINQAEVLVRAARQGREEEVLGDLEALGIATTALPEDAGVRLAQLRARTRSKMPDCCLLLTAEQTGGRVATFDTSLGRAAEALGLRLVS